MSLSCPKCGGPMRTYERNEVTVDQCTECRGVFLDRGELERLIDAEAVYTTTSRGAEWSDEGERRYPDRPDQRGHGRRRRGFLGDLFEID